MYVTNHNLRLPDSTRLKSSQCRASLKRKDDACPMGVNQRTLCAKNEKKVHIGSPISITAKLWHSESWVRKVSHWYKALQLPKLYTQVQHVHDQRCGAHSLGTASSSQARVRTDARWLETARACDLDATAPSRETTPTERLSSGPGAQLRPTPPWQGSAAPRASIAQRGGARSHRR